MNQRSFMYTCAAVTLTLLGSVTSAGAATISVPAGGDLQAALNAARPGDTILLAAGATYVGNFTLPVHGGTTYVTIRTGGNDAFLPATGARITPAHAQYLAKLRAPQGTEFPWMPALRTEPRAAYWRIMFVEFLANDNGEGDMVKLGDGSAAQNALSLAPHHLTLDRVYMHGDALMGQKRAIALNSGNTTVINSYVSGIKAVGQDSQAIGGWNGPGPYTIENNYLEAAGNVVLMGGSDPQITGLVPADLVFRRNTLTRPLSWRNPIMPIPSGVSATSGTGGTLAAGTYAYLVVARRPAGPASNQVATSARSTQVSATVGSSGRVTIRWNTVANATEYRVYGRTSGGQNMFWTVTTTSFTDTGAAGTTGNPPASGTVWQVKNLFELKNFRRAQVDFNLMENNWMQAQSGIAVLLTVRNQDGGCPQCVVEDVTFEYNVVRNIGGGFTILGEDYNYPSQQTNNIRIRHNEISGLDSVAWGGNGYFIKMSEGPRDITIDHNTIINPRGSGLVSVSGPPVLEFEYTNNIGRHNSYGIQGTGHGYGNTAIAHYFPGSTIRRNVFAGGRASLYPADNYFNTTTDFETQFVNYAAGNYALASDSDWADACTHTPAADLGANYAVLRPPVAPLSVSTLSLPQATAFEAYAATLVAAGGTPSYQWSIASGSLPAGITLNSGTGVLSGAASVTGNFAFTVRVTDSRAATATRALTLSVVQPTANSAPVVTLSASPTGVVPAGATVTLTAAATDSDGTIARVNFFLNGQSAGSDTSAPFRVTWVARSGGPFSFTATAIDNDGATTTSAPRTVQTTAEVVMYAADVQRIVGDYQLVADTTAAASTRLWNPNRDAAKLVTASAAPASYAEFTFYAEAGRPYRLWIRGKGEKNLWANDSAYLQFSGTVDAFGTATSRIGTTGSMWYSVEEYSNAGLLNWGWQDNGYGLNVVGASLYFAQTGIQTLRVQPREDGISIDQIVISPSRYLSAAPGLALGDATIVSKP